jgi:hypothetical protein
MARLLPCPFCGNERLSVCQTACGWHDPPIAYAVSCSGADCHGYVFALSYDLFKTEEEARKAWNTRAKPTGGKNE